MNNEEKNRALSAIEAIEAEAVRLGVKINLADLKCEIKSPSDGLAYISTHYAKVSIPAWGKVADVHIEFVKSTRKTAKLGLDLSAEVSWSSTPRSVSSAYMAIKVYERAVEFAAAAEAIWNQG